MRRILATTCCLTLAIALGPMLRFVTPVRAQQSGAVPEAQLDEEQILEDFTDIVDMIWTDQEESAWNDLRGDEERRAFIEEFWQRRDPTPATQRNEFRDIYMSRVAGAAEAFGNEGMEGYRTERGKFFIIYGNRAIVAQERRRGGGEISTGGGGGEDVGAAAARAGEAGSFMIAWQLDPAANPFLEGEDEVVFAPFQGTFIMSGGDIELSQEAFLAGTEVQEYVASQSDARTPSGRAASTADGEEDLTPEAAALRDLIENGVTRDDLELELELSHFPAPQGNTYTVVAFEVGKADLTFGDAGGIARLGGFGVVLDQPAGADAAPNVVHRIEAPFDVDRDQGDAESSATHTFGVSLIPGDYRLAWGVIDRASGNLTTVMHAFEVPDFLAGDLMVTSVAMAPSPIGRTDEPIDTDRIYDVTRIGGLVLDTDLDRTFERDETVAILYFVMGAAVDSEGQPQLSVEHRVLRAQNDQSIARLPTQELTYTAIAQNIPLGQIGQLQPGEDYKVQIAVTDMISGNEIVDEVPFSVAGEGSSPRP